MTNNTNAYNAYYPMNQNVDTVYGIGLFYCAENQECTRSVDTTYNFGNGNDLSDLL